MRKQWYLSWEQITQGRVSNPPPLPHQFKDWHKLHSFFLTKLPPPPHPLSTITYLKTVTYIVLGNLRIIEFCQILECVKANLFNLSHFSLFNSIYPLLSFCLSISFSLSCSYFSLSFFYPSFLERERERERDR